MLTHKLPSDVATVGVHHISSGDLLPVGHEEHGQSSLLPESAAMPQPEDLALAVGVVPGAAETSVPGQEEHRGGAARRLVRRLGGSVMRRLARVERITWNTEGYVEEAPAFAELIMDTSRNDPITFVGDSYDALGVNTHAGGQITMGEHECLVGLKAFLANAREKCSPELSQQAASMEENLTFIDNREYEKAARGIADKWRGLLRGDPRLQLCVVTGNVDKGMVKSDQYLFDRILREFTDEELRMLKGRLLDDPKHITADAEHVRLVLLDDWVISGKQMRSVIRGLHRDYPRYANVIEVQLIAATDERLRRGLSLSENLHDVLGPGPTVPVSAYFKARSADRRLAPWSGAHITGSHCSSDMEFNDALAQMCKDLGGGEPMPPGSNIVRPYRVPGFRLTQRQRLLDARGNQLYADFESRLRSLGVIG